ncbi:MAG: hypothetical protein HOO96_42325 [Polyangiaceae bacterium]|nr:hypothetical protein [Polyangiaceae bacterium]
MLEFSGERATGSLLSAKPSLLWELPLVQIFYRVDEDARLRVMVPFSLRVLAADKGVADPPELLASLAVRMALTYRPSDDGPAPQLSLAADFAGILGFMHAWPYFRADIQAFTAKLGLPPLTLPVIVSGQVPELAQVEELSGPVSQRPAKLPPRKAKGASDARRRRLARK